MIVDKDLLGRRLHGSVISSRKEGLRSNPRSGRAQTLKLVWMFVAFEDKRNDCSV